MKRALRLAWLGQGHVEPNPMVGCVLVREGHILGEGWHMRYGEPHAEVNALQAAARSGIDPTGADMYVTLEPCCHQGKTPPCTDAILRAGIRRVVVAQRDPFPKVAGGGIAILRERGARVEVGLLEAEARRLNAPYLTLIERRRPWIIAKWAMTLDGKTATRTGSSRWISNERSRAVVHNLRARMDAIMVGARTAMRDDPSLTVRLDDSIDAPPRTPVRIVWDSSAAMAIDSRLVRTAREIPVLVVVTERASNDNVARLVDAGCEVLHTQGDDPMVRARAVAEELGRRRMTNVLLEGGGSLAGTFFDARLMDEAHVFIAAKLVGGRGASTPIGGEGVEEMSSAWTFEDPHTELLGGDVYLWGRIRHEDPEASAAT